MNHTELIAYISQLYEDGFPSKSVMLKNTIDDPMLSEFKRKDVISTINQMYDNVFTDIYKPHRKVKHFTGNRETIVDRTHQIDLLKLPKDSSGAQYAMNVIDVASRKAASFPLGDTNTSTTRVALEYIYSSGQLRLPLRIQTDGGPEFKGSFNDASVDSYRPAVLTAQHITVEPYNVNHQAIIERFNQTLTKRLYRYMIRQEASYGGKPDELELTQGRLPRHIEESWNKLENIQYNDWVGVLQTCVDAYNNSIHRTIKMRPIDAYMLREIPNDSVEPISVTRAYDIGDSVRIKVTPRGGLQRRSTDPLWSSKTYMIANFNRQDDASPYRYTLSDMNLGILPKRYYEEELQKVEDTTRLTGWTGSNIARSPADGYNK